MSRLAARAAWQRLRMIAAIPALAAGVVLFYMAAGFFWSAELIEGRRA